MEARAAVVRRTGGGWGVEQVSLRSPGPGEVHVRWVFAGLCYSDLHMERDQDEALPKIAGHEGAGVVLAVGPGVTRVAVGDHVAASPIPVCGRCRRCLAGRVTLCENAAAVHSGAGQPNRIEGADGARLQAHCGLGTLATSGLVSEMSLVPVDPGLPLEVVALISCGVLTGWGSVVHVAEVRPGQSVAIIGAGGVGANAIQAARLVGATTVTAVESRSERAPALLALGATDVVASAAEAMIGRPSGYDAVIICVGDLSEPVVSDGFGLTADGGALVLASLGDDVARKTLHLSGARLVLGQKRILGTLMGASNPIADIPTIAGLYERGDFKLDELITREYGLDDVAEGFDDLASGRNLRGLVRLDG